MNRVQMRALAAHCRDDVLEGAPERALERLSPTIAVRTPFPLLDLAGCIIAETGGARSADLTILLDGLAASGATGAWPLIGSALSAADLPHAVPHDFAEARRYILLAGVWHATDAIGERVAGQGLVARFDEALALLEGWGAERSAWLRRAVGVAAHFYVKREHEAVARAAQLLDLLAPLFEEREMDAVKGIGWGLKTLGRYHPGLLEDWLRCQLADRRARRLMVRKAVTYLPGTVKAEFA